MGNEHKPLPLRSTSKPKYLIPKRQVAPRGPRPSWGRRRRRSATTSASDCFNVCAATLVENGFTVIPTRGKKLILRRWNNQEPTDRVWLGKMVKANSYAGCNVGVVCGRVVGIDNTTADDADVAAA